MSVPPETGPFVIKSVGQGSVPTGISPGTTEPLASLPVVINGSFTTWDLVQQDNPNFFQFAISTYSYTGTAAGDSGDTIVTATTDGTQNLNWFVRYFESQDAYTIETNDNLGLAWTVPSTSTTGSAIEITSIPTTGSSPTQFNPSTSQLFTFSSPNSP